MAISVNSAVLNQHSGRGVFATIAVFFATIGAAIDASRALNSGRRPENKVLARLGIDPETFPKHLASE